MLEELPYADEIDIRTYESNIEQDTALGRVDAFVMDRVSSVQVIANSPLPLALAGEPFSEIRNALPFRDDEAGRALRDRVGMTEVQMMRRIILPQASRVAAPTLLNYFIDIIKSTSLAFTLGVTEMMGAAQREAAGSFRYFEAFLVVALIYWILVEALSFLQRRMELRLNRAFLR